MVLAVIFKVESMLPYYMVSESRILFNNLAAQRAIVNEPVPLWYRSQVGQWLLNFKGLQKNIFGGREKGTAR